MRLRLFVSIIVLLAMTGTAKAWTAHCRCQLHEGTSVGGALVQDFGELQSFDGFTPESQSNQNECKNTCARKAADWANDQGQVCRAVKANHAPLIRAYAAVGQRSWDWCGSSITPPGATSGVLKPRLFVLTILYALPGCTPTTSYNCASTSAAAYANGTSTETTVSLERSFNNTRGLSGRSPRNATIQRPRRPINV